MVCFSRDVDILRYEPVLFGELYLPGQVVSTGSGGVLSGTTFTASGADFVSAGVAAGGVAYFLSDDGVVCGVYEIVSTDSATQLTVSVVRGDSDASAVAPPAATSVTYRIATFDPQAAEVGFQLTEYFGIAPGNGESDVDADDILDTDVLRRASTFAVIASVYAMMASRAGQDQLWEKSRHYQRLFEKARERCKVVIDIGGDGVGDMVRTGGCGRLVRE